MPDSSSTLPYHGIRILDFSQVIAGPIATHLLNASGADVIKIEAPAKGDQLRKLVFSSRQDKSRDSAAFTAINRGKRSARPRLRQHRQKRPQHHLLLGIGLRSERAAVQTPRL